MPLLLQVHCPHCAELIDATSRLKWELGPDSAIGPEVFRDLLSEFIARLKTVAPSSRPKCSSLERLVDEVSRMAKWHNSSIELHIRSTGLMCPPNPILVVPKEQA